MEQLEKQRQQRIARGDAPNDVDRETAQMALNGVVTFFLDHRIESQPLIRLLGELAALTAGAGPSRMLAPAVTRHRRPDSPVIEGMKGRLAAIMEFRQQTGSTRKAAAQWVVRHAPAELKRRLCSVSGAAVNSWFVKWGGKRGTTSPSGREGYPTNARTHSKKQIRQIADSIRKFGFTNPILISDDDEIIAGHGRVEAAKLLGFGSQVR